MPYSDPARKRQWQKEYYRNRYQGDHEFRAQEAERKKPWYGINSSAIFESKRRRKLERQKKWQTLMPVADLFEEHDSFLRQFASLRTWLRWCSIQYIPAMKIDGKWHTSLAAIEWQIWQWGNNGFKELYDAPEKPSWAI